MHAWAISTCACASLAATCRTRAKGDINGKSANLNNALKSLIYQQHVANPAQIPLGELVVVFDADMQVSPCTQGWVLPDRARAPCSP